VPAAVLTVLGSGTLLPDPEGHSAAYHVRTEGATFLFDCGAGTLHGLAAHGIDWRALTHVVISHYHNDHVGDLPALMFALKHGFVSPRTAGLALIGPKGFGAFLRRVAAAFGDHVLDPGFPVSVVELGPDDEHGDTTSGLELTCRETPHTDESMAYKLKGAWGTFGYTGDTGPSSDVADFLSESTVLVAECAHDDPPPTRIHLSPSSLAAMAGAAAPGLLVVTHVYPPQGREEAVSAVRARYDGPVVVGTDGLRIRMDSHGFTVAPPAAAV